MFLSRVLTVMVLAVALSGCSTPNPPGEDELPKARYSDSGGYEVIGPYYSKVGPALVAADSSGQLWQLRQPQFDMGTMNGATQGTVERWMRVGGSRVQTYRRTWETFSDQTKPPVFVLN